MQKFVIRKFKKNITKAHRKESNIRKAIEFNLVRCQVYYPMLYHFNQLKRAVFLQDKNLQTFGNEELKQVFSQKIQDDQISEENMNLINQPSIMSTQLCANISVMPSKQILQTSPDSKFSNYHQRSQSVSFISNVDMQYYISLHEIRLK